MKLFIFRAGNSKDDRNLGLAFPITLAIPTAIVLGILEALFPGKNITHMATVNGLVEVAILLPSFILSGLIFRAIKKKCGHDFKVRCENKQVIVWENNRIVFDDTLEDITIKRNRMEFTFTIYGSENKMTFIGRSNLNPFGFSKARDLLEMRNAAIALEIQLVA